MNQNGNYMKKTYAQLQKEIADLEAKASKLKQAEVAGVIAKLKDAIAAYGLTVQDLFGHGIARGKRSGVTAKTKSKKDHSAKFADGNGNTWVGRGPRPQWLRDALAAGSALSDFDVSSKPKGATVSVSRKVSAKNRTAKRTRGAGQAKFRDAAGNSWTGHGKRPNWYKEALASGKSPEDLMV